MFHEPLYSFFVVVTAFITFTKSAELTFDLPDHRKECFYETFEVGERAQLDFRVISGGKYDIDVKLFAPDNQMVYQGAQLQHGGHVFSVEKSGAYSACFSNEFSTFTHKLVFFVLRSGRESPQVDGDGADSSPDSQLLTSLHAIRASLAVVSDYQTHIRLSEAQDRIAAEDTIWRVSAWAMVETLAVVATGVGQVLFVRSLFPASVRRLPVST